MSSAGQVFTPAPAADPSDAVTAAAACHISTASKWISRDQIIRRMNGNAPAIFNAARNAVPPLIENRGYGKGDNANDAYRLSDEGWKLAGGKPLWL